MSAFEYCNLNSQNSEGNFVPLNFHIGAWYSGITHDSGSCNPSSILGAPTNKKFMDVFSHGLWGGVALGRKERSYFWWAFFISIFPDAASFGVLMVARIFGLSKNSGMAENHMDISQIPNFVNWLYNITHSLIIFALVFLSSGFYLKKPSGRFWLGEYIS